VFLDQGANRWSLLDLEDTSRRFRTWDIPPSPHAQADSPPATLLALSPRRGVWKSDGRTAVQRSFPTKKEDRISEPILVWREGAETEKPLELEHAGVAALAFSPTAKRLASGDKRGEVLVWDLTLPVHKVKMTTPTPDPNNGVTALAFAGDGALLAGARQNGEITLWDARGTKVGSFTLLLHAKERIECLAFAVGHPVLAIGSDEGNIHLCQRSTGEVLGRFYGHTRSVSSIIFFAKDQLLASGSAEGTIKVWDTDMFVEMLTLRGPRSAIRSLAVSSTETTLISGSLTQNGKGVISFWRPR
jgi:WD40 repeat protein